MEYTVKVTGTEQVDKLAKSVEALESVLKSSRGSGKALEEVRKIVIGFKGQASVFEQLAKSIGSIDPAITRLESSFKGFGSNITHVLKSELEKSRAVLRTELATLAAGLGSSLSKKLGDNVGGALEDGLERATKIGKGAAAKARAEMTAEYNKLVGGEGLKPLGTDEKVEVSRLQKRGATISTFHRKELADYEKHIQSLKVADAEFLRATASTNDREAAIRAKNYADNVSGLNSLLALKRQERTALQREQEKITAQAAAMELARAKQTFAGFESSMGLSKGTVVKSAKDSASVFAGAYATELSRFGQTMKTFEASLGLDNGRLAKSAKDSADVFSQAYTTELARSKQTLANFEASLGLNNGRLAKSAKDSAEVFAGAYTVELSRFSQSMKAFEASLGLNNGRLAKSAKDSASVFAAAYDIELSRFSQTMKTFEASLGLNNGKLAKSAKDSAEVFSQAYATELAQSKQNLANFEALFGFSKASVAKSAKDSAEVFSQVYATEMAKSKQLFANFQSSLGIGEKPKSAKDSASAFSSLGMGPIRETKTPDGKPLRDLSKDAGDAHAAVRGLASGFNALWLTWGNLGPLLAGAALSNTFMKSAKEGMEVANTLQVIASLGEASASEVAGLNAELMRTASDGIHGPQEVAKAMQTMVLAGMRAQEVMTEVGTVMNFSMAGTTSIQNAADVLVSVTTAFGTGAEGFSRSSDIIVRAAADSKASVESFGEAMKTASVVGEQFGASQEDVAALISLLANLGITGTAAGTSIRNMFSDLSGRTAQTTKIMQRFNLDFRDASTGAMLPLIQMVEKLDTAMKKMDPKAAKDFLGALLSERGGKAMVAALAAYNQQVTVSGVETNKLQAQLTRLETTFGDSAIAAARMGETTLNAWKRTGSELENTLYKAFQAMEPQLYSMANSMDALFGDPKFIEAVTQIATAVASVGTAVGDNIGLITVLLGSWGAWKLTSVALVSAFSAMQKAGVAVSLTTAGQKLNVDRLTVSMGLATEATLAKAAADKVEQAGQVAGIQKVGTAIGLFGRLVGVLTGVGAALMIGATAWDIYNKAKDRGASQAALAIEREGSASAGMLKNAAEQRKQAADILAGRNENEESNYRQMQEESAKNIGVIEKEVKDKKALYDKANKDYSQYVTENFKLLGSNKSNTTRSIEAQASASSLKASRDTLSSQLYDLNAQKQNAQDVSRIAEEEVRSAAKAKADAIKTRDEAKKAENKLYGVDIATLQFDRGDPLGKGAGGAGGGGKDPSVMSSYYNSDYEEFKKYADAKKALQEIDYREGKISAEQYYDFLAKQAEDSYEKEKKALEDKQGKLAGSGKSADVKAASGVGVALKTLGIEQEVKLRDIGSKRLSDVEARLVSEGKIAAFGNDYLEQIKNNESGLVAIQRGSDFAAVAQARSKIEYDFYKQRVRLEEDYQKSIKGLDEKGKEEKRLKRDADLASVRDFESKALALTVERIAKEDAARTEAANGVDRAIRGYNRATMDMATQAETVTSGILSGLEQSLVNVATTGKLSFKSMADSIISEMARIAAKQITSGLSSLIGIAVNAGMNWMTGGSSANVTGVGGVDYGLTSPTIAPHAKGAAYSGSASLSQYSNQVHSTPKTFAFAQGGVFGEAGPEAIMPLTRGADGNLGVRSSGGSAEQDITINMEVINNTGPSTAKASIGRDSSGKALITMIIDAVAEDTASGGKTARATKQRFSLKG